MLAVRF